MVIAVLVFFIPALLYIGGEVWNKRLMRISAIIVFFPVCAFAALMYAGTRQLEYNVKYGKASQELIVEIRDAVKEGQSEYVVMCLKEISDEYRPTYEERYDFVGLANKTTVKLKARE